MRNARALQGLRQPAQMQWGDVAVCDNSHFGPLQNRPNQAARLIQKTAANLNIIGPISQRDVNHLRHDFSPDGLNTPGCARNAAITCSVVWAME